MTRDYTGPEATVVDLPTGWTTYAPVEADVEDLVLLLRRHEQHGRGSAGADIDSVSAEVTGRGARTRRHQVVRDEAGHARAWVNCHDRARERVLVGVTVDPDLDAAVADQVAGYCFGVAQRYSTDTAHERRTARSHMDSGAFDSDERQQRWLASAGFTLVRHWWQMSRPVTHAEINDDSVAALGTGVHVRRVRRDDVVGMPHDDDLRDVHRMLEISFADHFNSCRETFEEFVGRLREDPGHRWEHWWLAMVDDEPAGALVATTTTGHVDEQGRPQRDSTYVDYIGVDRNARGRGVAKALLRTVIADAAARGRDQVSLEVDADSPTGADTLYLSMGWQTRYVTQSWHKELAVEVDSSV